MAHRRRKLFVDRPVQGALVLRTVLYTAYYFLVVFLLTLCATIVAGPASPATHVEPWWLHFGPMLIGGLLIVPIVAVDMLRVSNRFAGPMVRLRRAMRELAEGKAVEPVYLRKGDFWDDFAADVNRVAARLRSTERPAREPEDIGIAGSATNGRPAIAGSIAPSD